jgi:group I intron endonuclease
MSKYILYVHINKLNNKKYIGITCNIPSKRWANGNGYSKCPKFWNSIQKYGWNNFTHEILFTNMSKEEAEQKEIELIKKYKTTDDVYGYNLSNGGSHNGKHTKETKDKISIANKGKPKPYWKDKHHKLETLIKMSIASKGHKRCVGRKCSDETKLKSSQAKENKKKVILQIDIITNKIIKEWIGVKKTARYLKVNHSSLFGCLNGKQHTCCGFKWIYKKVGEE